MFVCADPKISTLTPNGHLDLAPAPNARGLYLSERLSFALSSRKSSVSSLGRASLEQTTLVSHCACCSQPAIHYRVLLTEKHKSYIIPLQQSKTPLKSTKNTIIIHWLCMY